MPSLQLTPSQQAAIDAANKTLADAQAAYDKQLAIFNSVKDNLCNQGWWQYLTDCDVRNVQSTATRLLVSFSGPLGWLINEGAQKKWTKPSSCKDAIEKGIILKWECKVGHGNCIKKEGCNDRVKQYNEKLQGYYSAAQQLEGASLLVQSAKTNLTAVVEGIQKDPTVQANADIIKNEENQEASKKRLNIIFFGLAALLIVGLAVYFGAKVFKAGASA